MGTVLLLAATALAGCTSGDDGGLGANEKTGGLAIGTPAIPDVSVNLEPPKPIQRALFLSTNGLVEEAPASSSQTMKGSYARCFVQPPCTTLEFASAPSTGDVQIGPAPVVAKLWVQADGPVASTNFFDWAVWFGTSRGMGITTTKTTGQPMLPGAPVLVELTMAFGDLLPLVAGRGDPFQLYVMSGLVHEESGTLKILYGGSHASQVQFTTTELRQDPLANATRGSQETIRGTIPESMWPLGMAGVARDSARTAKVTLGKETTFLEIAMKQTGGVSSNVDLDLDVKDGSTIRAGGHTPYNHESVFVAGPSIEKLRNRELTLQVGYFFGASSVDYEIAVRHD